MIELQNVGKVFKRKDISVEALKNVNLKIDKGDIFGVIGFSGAGKSTLIRLVNSLEEPSSGSVIVADKDLNKLSTKELRNLRKQIGMIFQHFNLLNSKTVFDNIAIPLKLNNTPKSEIEKRVNELLEFVGLESKAKSYPDELSGGQKQRVGIARALATNPLILLCDEATSALDPQTTESILELLKKINKEYNITILIITHEMNVIKDICNKVAVIEKGEIIEEGSVLEVFGRPKEETTKSFVRTVIKDSIPKSIINSLSSEEGNNKVLKLGFVGTNTKEALISAIAKRFDVETNILFATVTEIQGTVLGNLIVQLRGEEFAIELAYKYLKDRNVVVEEVLIW
ncbi:methionine ABC transporter ATP-binding protein [Clostridium paraputrificum]|uniref:methionine ABC transporter ATP-binding protein n=1 Tax=Clostridium TaxID=1485 RepID=UPI003D358CF1